jgi:DNA-binding MarR family transcriptional regulator
MFNKFQLGTQPATFLAKAKLSSAAALVLLKMMYHTNRVNIVSGTPKGIADKVGITIGDFTVGIRALKGCDFIRKYTKKEYMLNPDIMFNGDDRQYFIVKHMWDTQTSRGLRA